jgi:hypothetical protein
MAAMAAMAACSAQNPVTELVSMHTPEKIVRTPEQFRRAYPGRR